LPDQLCNKLLSLGKHVKLEKLSNQELQKNCGRSVAVRAPGLFVSQLIRKAAHAGSGVETTTTWKAKLPQSGI
jgi:hypothetical protein